MLSLLLGFLLLLVVCEGEVTFTSIEEEVECSLLVFSLIVTVGSNFEGVGTNGSIGLFLGFSELLSLFSKCRLDGSFSVLVFAVLAEREGVLSSSLLLLLD